MRDYIGAIDQGTTGTRFIVFDRDRRMAACAQKEHRQISPPAGWVEHDADEIWQRTQLQLYGELKWISDCWANSWAPWCSSCWATE